MKEAIKMRKKIFINMCMSTLIVLVAAISLYLLFFPIFGIEVSIALFIATAILVNFLLALYLTRKIANSISSINFDSPPEDIDTYDELASFVRTILRQQNQIETQITELEQQSETMNAIFENINDGFIMIGHSGIIVTANQSTRSLFGTDESCIGNNINFLTRDTSFLGNVRAALQGHSCQMIMEQDQVYQVSFIPSADRGAIIFISNMTEQQLSEKMRREFSANVSHELNTPLTCISGFAEMLSRGNTDPQDVVHFGSKIKEESDRMIGMVENILFLSEIDEMDSKDGWSEFDLSQVANDAINTLSSMADAAQIGLTLSDTPCYVYANRQLVYALFTNLISNAIRYNKPKGWVKVGVSLKNQTVYISVTDTGIGIPKEVQHHVFERFYRVDRSRSQKTGGTGLGLSIVKHIVRHHNGTIGIESVPDEGTRVFIRIPDGFSGNFDH